MTSAPDLHLAFVPWEDGVDLDIRTTLPVTAAEVWAQLVDPAACGAWFAPFTRAGDTLTFDAGDGETFTAAIIHCAEEADLMLDFADFGLTGFSLRPAGAGPDTTADADPTADADAATEIIVTRPHPDYAAAAEAIDSGIEALWPTHLELLAAQLGHPLANQDNPGFLGETLTALTTEARANAAEASR